MDKQPLEIIGIPSPLDIAEVVKGMAFRAVKAETGFQYLQFVAKESPCHRIDTEERTSFEKKGYEFRDSVMRSLRWVVEIHKLAINDDTRLMHIQGKINLGSFILLDVKVECDLRNGVGIMDDFSFDQRAIN